MSMDEVETVVADLRGAQFAASAYDLCRNNSNHFVDALLRRCCGGKTLPSFVNRFAELGRAALESVDEREQRQLLEQVQNDETLPMVAEGGGGESSSPRNLSAYLDLQQCECLNESDEHPLRPVLEAATKPPKKLSRRKAPPYCESNCDAQLVIHLQFKGAVRLALVALRGGDDDDDGHCVTARRVSLFVNDRALNFDDIEEASAVDDFDNLEALGADGSGAYAVPAARFSNVRTLTLFVRDNATRDDDRPTRVSGIILGGRPVAEMDMAELKAIDDGGLEI